MAVKELEWVSSSSSSASGRKYERWEGMIGSSSSSSREFDPVDGKSC